ncbi:MAG TPA: alpha/beta fold hydrolase [Actinomycetota bacterium]|nr:alpha/beta fold hydrolase [Actinomycetota bacterium]
MATLVLVHGSWHGGWCWEEVAAALAADGNTVFAPDLPAHGGDRTPPGEVGLDTYTGFLGALLTALDEPAVLVGHSFGGAVISQAAEKFPGSVAGLVFVCAFLLRHGQSVWRHGVPRSGSPVLRPPHLLADEDAGVLDLDRAVVRKAFYGGCPDRAAERALELWQPEPLGPLRTPLSLTGARFGSLPKAYLQCRQDRVLPIEAQQRMCRLSPCDRVAGLDAGHSPFFSHPEELAGHLHRLCSGYFGR